MHVRLFLSDVDDAGGAFAVVPHPPTLGTDEVDARRATELYENEQLVRNRPDVVVLYLCGFLAPRHASDGWSAVVHH